MKIFLALLLITITFRERECGCGGRKGVNGRNVTATQLGVASTIETVNSTEISNNGDVSLTNNRQRPVDEPIIDTRVELINLTRSG